MNSRCLTLACAVSFAFLAVPLPASAQLVSSAANGSVPSLPYTAEFRTTRVQTLANGATITRETREVRARDAQGQTMMAITPIPAVDGEKTFTTVHVDLADRTVIDWNSGSRRARVLHMQPMGSGGCWSSEPSNDSTTVAVTPPRAEAGGGVVGGTLGAGSGGGFAGSVQLPDVPPQSLRQAPIKPQREDLGTDTIMGVEVKGFRITHTTPPGRIGNDVPLVRTEEIWTAPSLGGMVLREITDDPQSGKSTRELVSLDLSEPDPSVFAPPEGYEVVDEQMHPVPCQSAR